MSFCFYLGGILLPVAPAAVSVRSGNRFSRVDLTNGDEVTLGNSRALDEISFSALLPAVKYPFAVYEQGFRLGDDILAEIRKLASTGLPFRFVILRGGSRASTNINALFRELNVREDATDGSDIYIDVKLTEYREYNAAGSLSALASAATANSGATRTHTVVAGDSLWSIAQRYLGDGGRYREVYERNRAVIDSGNVGTGNTTYTIYPGQNLIV